VTSLPAKEGITEGYWAALRLNNRHEIVVVLKQEWPPWHGMSFKAGCLAGLVIVTLPW